MRGGEGVLRRLFEPLGYDVEAVEHPLDERFPEWGESRYFSVDLRRRATPARAADAPVRPGPGVRRQKHYCVGDDEVEKLLRRARAGWPGTPSGRRSSAAT